MQARNTRFVRDDATDAIGLWEGIVPQNQPGSTAGGGRRAACRVPALQGGVRIGGDQGPGLDRAPSLRPRAKPVPVQHRRAAPLATGVRTGVAEGIGGRELADVPGAGRAQKGRVSIELTQHALQTVVGHPHAVCRRPRPAGAKRAVIPERRATSAQSAACAEVVRSPSTAARCGRCSELYLPGCEETHVAYIICEPCIGTKDAACVDVCPVDCIHPRKDESAFAAAEMLHIHPDECIDCGACVPACPVRGHFCTG